MIVNMSNLDRAIRILISIIVIGLIQQQVIVGILSTLVVGAVIVVITTAVFGICPLYGLLGISTTKTEKQ